MNSGQLPTVSDSNWGAFDGFELPYYTAKCRKYYLSTSLAVQVNILHAASKFLWMMTLS